MSRSRWVKFSVLIRSSWVKFSVLIVIAAVLLSGSWFANNISEIHELNLSGFVLHHFRFPYFATSELFQLLFDMLTKQNGIFLLFLALAVIFSSKHFTRHLEALMWPFKSVKIFGTEIAFNREATNELSQGLSDVIKMFRHGTDKKLADLTNAQGVGEAMDKFGTKLRAHLTASQKCPAETLDFRVTIHLRDILFEHTFVQLIDYHPSGYGFGRRFSARYGIIGLTWRTGENKGHCNAPVDEDELIQSWAMFRDEARKRISSSKLRPSLLCCILKGSADEQIGVLYIDSQRQNEFGDDLGAYDLAQTIIPSWSEFKVLQQLVGFISDEIRTTTARVRIYDV